MSKGEYVVAPFPDVQKGMAYSNKVLLRGFSIPAHVRVKGGQVYSTASFLEPVEGPMNMLGTNSSQREACGIERGQSVEVEPWTEDDCHAITVRVVLDTFPVKKRKTEVKEDVLTAHFISTYAGQAVSPGSIWNVDLDGMPLKLMIKGVDAVVLDQDSNAADASASTAGGRNKRGAPTKSVGAAIITKTTSLVCTLSPACKLIDFVPSESAARSPLLDPNWRFEDMGIGGLDSEFSSIFRRAFSTRLLPADVIARLGVKHVKGMLLYGPPGTGKTLIARQIGKMLAGKEPKIVNGPEILNKFVGQAEENIRNLFADAEKDWAEHKEKSGLHIIIFDEIDAICKARGSVRSGTGVHDTVVNQLLTKIDGVNTPNNFLVIGMTNRKDMLDPALLRPGRLEVHVEISLPDEPGRAQILNIHTQKMRENGMLGPDVDIAALAERTKNFSGAELEGLVKSATSYAVYGAVDVTSAGVELKDGYQDMQVTMAHFDSALEEVHSAFGVSEADIKGLIQTELVDYGPEFGTLVNKINKHMQVLIEDPQLSTKLVLLTGPSGSGKTALAAKLAIDSGFPFAKLVAAHMYIGMSESAKAAEISQVFDQAYKTPLSIILIDDLEVLLEYVALGPRFSNVMLQTFISLLKTPPPRKDHKLLVLATTTAGVLDQLPLLRLFKATVSVPNLNAAQIARVLAATGCRLEDISKCAALCRSMGLKQLMEIVSLVKVGEKGVVSTKRFAELLADYTTADDEDDVDRYAAIANVLESEE